MTRHPSDGQSGGGLMTAEEKLEKTMAAEEAIRDWWYSERRQGMTSKEAAQSLIWHLAKCEMHIVRKQPPNTPVMGKEWATARR